MQSEPNRLDRIEALLESSARSIQALAEAIATDRLNRLEFQEEMQRITREAAEERDELRQATLGIANLLGSLDEDRPTIFRKLNAIENKLNQILERNNESQ